MRMRGRFDKVVTGSYDFDTRWNKKYTILFYYSRDGEVGDEIERGVPLWINTRHKWTMQ